MQGLCQKRMKSITTIFTHYIIRKYELYKFFFLISGKFIQKEICASVSSKWALKRHLRSCHTPQDLEEFEIISGKESGNRNLRATPDPNPDLEVWQNWLWSFQLGDTKLTKFLAIMNKLRFFTALEMQYYWQNLKNLDFLK